MLAQYANGVTWNHCAMIRQQRLCSAVNLIIGPKQQIHMGHGQQAADLYLLVLCSELTDEDVRTAIKNSGGVKGSLLIPEAPFELLVRRAISRLLPSALQCQQFVHAELLRIASQCAPADVTRFPNLQVNLSQHTLQSMLIAHCQEKFVLCSVTYEKSVLCSVTYINNHDQPLLHKCISIWMCTWTTQDRRSFLYNVSNNLFPVI